MPRPFNTSTVPLVFVFLICSASCEELLSEAYSTRETARETGIVTSYFFCCDIHRAKPLPINLLLLIDDRKTRLERMRKEMAKKFVLLMLLARFTICICAQISSSSLNQDTDSEFNKQSASSSLCFEKYITEPYVRQYESLIDSNFQEYLRHNLPLNSEKALPRLLDLGRHLIGEGSHRHLSSSVTFSIQPDLVSNLSSRLCEVTIIERLPSGVFADPFELGHIVQQGVFKDVSVFGDINLELPSFRSNRSIVEIHLEMDLNKSSGKEIVQDFRIELPLHARYPPLGESGYSEVIFGVPDFLLRCMSLELSPAVQSCLLTRIPSDGDLALNPVVWLIPAGIKAHAKLVSVFTFASALLSAISIIIVSLKQSPPVSGERLKQT